MAMASRMRLQKQRIKNLVTRREPCDLRYLQMGIRMFKKMENIPGSNMFQHIYEYVHLSGNWGTTRPFWDILRFKHQASWDVFGFVHWLGQAKPQISLGYLDLLSSDTYPAEIDPTEGVKDPRSKGQIQGSNDPNCVGSIPRVGPWITRHVGSLVSMSPPSILHIKFHETKPRPTVKDSLIIWILLPKSMIKTAWSGFQTDKTSNIIMSNQVFSTFSRLCELGFCLQSRFSFPTIERFTATVLKDHPNGFIRHRVAWRFDGEEVKFGHCGCGRHVLFFLLHIGVSFPKKYVKDSKRWSNVLYTKSRHARILG